jgi:kynurenine formamidase
VILTQHSGLERAPSTGPAYDSLPLLGELGLRHSWGVWGEQDRLGTLNRITDVTTLRALATPTTGRRIGLSLPLNFMEQPLYGRSPLDHHVFDRNRNMVEDEIRQLDPQASSQWDSLRHIRARQFGHYGGVEAADPAVAELGVGALVRHGLVVRGVLVDLPAYWDALGELVDPFDPHVVTAADLYQALGWQATSWESGDLLLVRTGWLDRYRHGGIAPDSLAMPPSAGLSAAEDTARFLWDEGFCAIAADNPAVEVLPGDHAIGSLHRRLIPGLGMPLGELWDLDALAEHCRSTRRYTMCVATVPLNLPGAVASPANAVAIV